MQLPCVPCPGVYLTKCPKSCEEKKIINREIIENVTTTVGTQILQIGLGTTFLFGQPLAVNTSTVFRYGGLPWVTIIMADLDTPPSAEGYIPLAGRIIHMPGVEGQTEYSLSGFHFRLQLIDSEASNPQFRTLLTAALFINEVQQEETTIAFDIPAGAAPATVEDKHANIVIPGVTPSDNLEVRVSLTTPDNLSETTENFQFGLTVSWLATETQLL